jgi:hypothetical protein
MIGIIVHLRLCIPPPDDDVNDLYLKKITIRGVTKSNPTQKCRPAKGISKRVNKQITINTYLDELEVQ